MLDKRKPPLKSLYNTPVTCKSLPTLAFKMPPPILLCVSVVTCAAVRGGAVDCLGGLFNGLSYQCLTFVLVFDPQKIILFLCCGPLYTAAGTVVRCAAETLSTQKEKGKKEVLPVRVEMVTFRVTLYSKLSQQSYDDDPQSCWPTLEL